MGYKWGHDRLLLDLACEVFSASRSKAIGVWKEPRLLIANTDGKKWSQPDLFVYMDMRPVIYEVKTNRNDFLGEIQTGKWLKYRRYCSEFYFASPEGLISPHEVPFNVGLVVRAEMRGFHNAHTAEINNQSAGFPRTLGYWKLLKEARRIEYSPLSEITIQALQPRKYQGRQDYKLCEGDVSRILRISKDALYLLFDVEVLCGTGRIWKDTWFNLNWLLMWMRTNDELLCMLREQHLLNDRFRKPLSQRPMELLLENTSIS